MPIEPVGNQEWLERLCANGRLPILFADLFDRPPTAPCATGDAASLCD